MAQCCIRACLTGLVLFLCFIAEIPRPHAAERCEGSARRPHDLGRYDFTTTSRVYRRDGAEWYETCVENNGEGDLWVDWYVPGPVSYVLPQTAVPSPRTFDTRDTQGLEGCLEYGNLAETMREHFLGHASDISTIDGEKKKDCDYWAAASVPARPRDLQIAELTIPFRIFFPSNRKYARSTMLMMKGEARVIPGDEGHYSTSLEYQVEKVEGRDDGNAHLVRLRPVGQGLAEKYLKDAFFQKYLADFGDRGIPLRWRNAFSLTMDVPARGALTSTRYGLFDESDDLVGAIFVPLWAPTVPTR